MPSLLSLSLSLVQSKHQQATIASVWITEVAFGGDNISSLILKYEHVLTTPPVAGHRRDLTTHAKCRSPAGSCGHKDATTPAFDGLANASVRLIGREMMARWSIRLMELALWANRAGIHAYSELATCTLANVAGLDAGSFDEEDVAVIDVGTGKTGRALARQCNSKGAFDAYVAAFPGGGLNKLYHPIKFLLQVEQRARF